MKPIDDMKQKGFIIEGGGINYNKWISDAEAEGYTIVLRVGYCELWK